MDWNCLFASSVRNVKKLPFLFGQALVVTVAEKFSLMSNFVLKPI